MHARMLFFVNACIHATSKCIQKIALEKINIKFGAYAQSKELTIKLPAHFFNNETVCA